MPSYVVFKNQTGILYNIAFYNDVGLRAPLHPTYVLIYVLIIFIRLKIYYVEKLVILVL